MNQTLSLRLSADRRLVIQTTCPDLPPTLRRTAAAAPRGPAPGLAPAPGPGSTPPASAPASPTISFLPAQPLPTLHLTSQPIITLIEATPCGAEDLLLGALALADEAGARSGIISLDRANRLARRLSGSGPAPAWCWNALDPALFLLQETRTIVPGPDTEASLSPDAVQRVIRTVSETSHAVFIDLGCRWDPKLFRPVLALATQIWIVTRAGQWTALEMRLEQAEFSAWTDMTRIRTIALGDPGSAVYGAKSVTLLPGPGAPATREFLLRELRGAR